ncbi:hypothetical protein, partial [Leisingera sp. ANG-M6]|uniref:hypothetical protein n=1 Tax=Leisingera sp. ANG-M6 TaxID=1577900 RepID=UPI0019D32611
NRLSGPFPVQLSVAAAPSGVSQLRLSAAGEGAFTDTPEHPQPKKRKKQNFPKRKITNQTISTTYTTTKSATLTKNPKPAQTQDQPNHTKTPPETTYPQTQQTYPQNQNQESKVQSRSPSSALLHFGQSSPEAPTGSAPLPFPQPQPEFRSCQDGLDATSGPIAH